MLTLKKSDCKSFFDYFQKNEEDFGDLVEELALCHRPKTEKKL